MDLGQDEAGKQVYAVHCEVSSSPLLLPHRPCCADLATTMTLAMNAGQGGWKQLAFVFSASYHPRKGGLGEGLQTPLPF